MPKKIDARLLGIQILWPSDKVLEPITGYDIELVHYLLQGPLYSKLASIVAVHGLGANPATTWTAKNDNIQKQNSQNTAEGFTQEPEYINWLSHPDMLPSRISCARIMTFNHDSQWYGEDAVSLRLDPLASSFLRAIIDERKVFFICDGV